MLAQISELPDGVEGLEARGTLTSGDYAQVFAPLVERHRQGGQRLRLLYQFGPEFRSFTLAALWADSKLGARYLPVLDGCDGHRHRLDTRPWQKHRPLDALPRPGLRQCAPRRRGVLASVPRHCRSAVNRADDKSLLRRNRRRVGQHRKAPFAQTTAAIAADFAGRMVAPPAVVTQSRRTHLRGIAHDWNTCTPPANWAKSRLLQHNCALNNRDTSRTAQ
jgi:hypothetical protein